MKIAKKAAAILAAILFILAATIPLTGLAADSDSSSGETLTDFTLSASRTTLQLGSNDSTTISVALTPPDANTKGWMTAWTVSPSDYMINLDGTVEPLQATFSAPASFATPHDATITLSMHSVLGAGSVSKSITISIVSASDSTTTPAPTQQPSSSPTSTADPSPTAAPTSTTAPTTTPSATPSPHSATISAGGAAIAGETLDVTATFPNALPSDSVVVFSIPAIDEPVAGDLAADGESAEAIIDVPDSGNSLTVNVTAFAADGTTVLAQGSATFPIAHAPSPTPTPDNVLPVAVQASGTAEAGGTLIVTASFPEALSDGALVFFATTGDDEPTLGTLSANGKTAQAVISVPAEGQSFTVYVVATTFDEQTVLAEGSGTFDIVEPARSITLSDPIPYQGQTMIQATLSSGWTLSPQAEIAWSVDDASEDLPYLISEDQLSILFSPDLAGTLTVTIQIEDGGIITQQSRTYQVTEVTPEPSPGQPASEPSSTPTPEPTPQPTPSATPEPTPAPSTSETPLAPNPSATIQVKITTDPQVSGDVITGIPISTEDDIQGVGKIQSLVIIPQGAVLEVLNAEGQAIENPATRVSTGQIVQVTDQSGAVIAKATVVVTADVLGTGEMDIAQVVRTAQACTGEDPLHGAYLAAGDMNGNGTIDIVDIVLSAKIMLQAAEEE